MNTLSHHTLRLAFWLAVGCCAMAIGCESDGGRMLDKGGNLGANIGALLGEPMGWADAGSNTGRAIGQKPGYLRTTPQERAERQAW